MVNCDKVKRNTNKGGYFSYSTSSMVNLNCICLSCHHLERQSKCNISEINYGWRVESTGCNGHELGQIHENINKIVHIWTMMRKDEFMKS